MRLLPERLPFGMRLFLAFVIPLLIWVLVSAASIYIFNKAQESYDALASAKRIVVLATDYRHAAEDIQEAERAYLITSAEQHLQEHGRALRNANRLRNELIARVDVPEQAERLDDAADTLQNWYYEFSRRRVEMRRALPQQGVRTAYSLQQKLLAMLSTAEEFPDASVAVENIQELRDLLGRLAEYAREGRGRRVVVDATEQLARYEGAAIEGNRVGASDALRAMAQTLAPSLAEIISAEMELYSLVERPASAAMTDAFEEKMTEFLSAEQQIVGLHRQNAATAGEVIRWMVWSGLALGILIMAVVILWFARRLGHSLESIDDAAEELARGNFDARAIGVGSTSKLAAHFNKMAEYVQKRHEQTKLLASLSETLHNCRSIEEAMRVFGEFGAIIFPDQPGVLYEVATNGVDLAKISAWGGGDDYTQEHMTMEDCWGLRLTRMHENGSEGTSACNHLKGRPDSLCVPLPAFGQIIGLIFITLDPDNGDYNERERQRQFIDSIAEQVSLALANVKLRQELKSQAIRDPLTQLYNRRHLTDTMERELHRAERHDNPLAVLAFDIDHFKRFNDTHGHDGGDAVLRGMGEMLRDFFRPEDGVFRSGGEEFIAVLPGTEREDALARAEELRRAVGSMNVVKGNAHLPTITISVGVAIYPSDSETCEDLLKAADVALYEAKGRGRNCVISAHEVSDTRQD